MRAQSVFIQVIIGVVIVLMPIISYGQQEYFYSTKGQKVYMDIAEDLLVVKPATILTAEQMRQALVSSFTNVRVEKVTGLSSEGFYEIRFDSGSVTKQQLATRFAEMRTDNAWEVVNPVYLIEGSPAIVYDIFVVNLSDESGLKELEGLNKRYALNQSQPYP